MKDDKLFIAIGIVFMVFIIIFEYFLTKNAPEAPKPKIKTEFKEKTFLQKYYNGET